MTLFLQSPTRRRCFPRFHISHNFYSGNDHATSRLMRLLQCLFAQATRLSIRSFSHRRFQSSKSVVDVALQDLATTDAPHNSLASFLSYADRTGLSKKSTVYNGTYYEYLCQKSLKSLGFKLHRTGGRNDLGIDLLGQLQLPSQDHPLQCIVQCKALNKRLSPSLVRELEGSFSGAPSLWAGDNVVGVLCSPKPATKGVREAIQKSGRAAMWIMVEGAGASEGRIVQAVWNQKMADMGAEGVGVGVVHRAVGSEGGVMQQEVRLTWKGQIWAAPKP
jgi:hypothetical protein